MEKYSQIVSLGKFCGVAMELERKGLRNASYPFDWLISDSFEKIVSLIKNNFYNFLIPDNLYQESDPSHYYDPMIDIHFFHDFKANLTLEKQIPKVRMKYKRRIERFYEQIQKPTLFIRYCSGLEDEKYVKKHEREIFELITSFNSRNRILYVMSTQEVNRFVPTDYGGVVYVKHPVYDIERRWIDNVPGLNKFLYKSIAMSVVDIVKNILIHYRSRIMKKFVNNNSIDTIHVYRHDKQTKDLNMY